MTARRLASLALLGAFLVLAEPAQARGRFERGRNLVQQRCAPCRTTGWIWAPSVPDATKPHDLAAYAKAWSPAAVCTWMRRQTRKAGGATCYPGFISERDRLDMLFYLHRRAQGPVVPPRIARPAPFRLYKGKPLKRTLALRRATVEKQRKAQEELARMRRLSRSRHGDPKVSGKPPKASPPTRGGR